MIGCGKARETIVESARRAASEAALLELDAHLARCAACHAERARWSLLDSLRRYEPPSLSSTARRRVLDRLMVEPPALDAKPAVEQAWRRPLGVACAIAAVVAVAAVSTFERRATPRAVAHATDANGALSTATRASLRVGLATVSFGSDAEVRIREDHAVVVARGEAEIEGAGAAEPMRVVGPSFSIAVRATRFVVSPDGVRPLDGELRVYDDGGREIAVVAAGSSWIAPKTSRAVVPESDAPSAAVTANEPTTAPFPLPVNRVVTANDSTKLPFALPVNRGAVAREQRSRSSAMSHKEPIVASVPASADTLSPTHFLEFARSALADGNAPDARVWLRRALAAGPSAHERAVADLLHAESLLVERRGGEAVVAYRAVADAHAADSAGESASFAVGQVLFEGGHRAEAARALHDYLARYPHGRFTREVGDRLTELEPAAR